MLLGRFVPILAVLALAGSLAQQAPRARGARARCPPHGPLFGVLVGGVILVAGLTFFPALALGPLVEALHDHPSRSSPRMAPADGRARRAARSSPDSCCDVAAGRAAQARPPHAVRNPVMFVVWVGSVLAPSRRRRAQRVRLLIAVWLWFTVLFANFAEAVAEGRGKAQAAILRRTKTDDRGARRLAPTAPRSRRPGTELQRRRPRGRRGGRDHPRRRRRRRGRRLGRRVGDHRRVGAGRSARRAATAARSPAAPASCPTASSCGSPPKPGETFLDRMIALVEGAARQKTPNEIALTILLAASRSSSCSSS